LFAAINIVIVYTGLKGGSALIDSDAAGRYSKALESVLFSLFVFAFTFSADVIERQNGIDIPDILEVAILIFVVAGTVLSVQFNLYYTIFWWDDLLHTISGVIMGFVGFILIYKINCKYSMDISPILTAVFSFAFAVTMGVFWEIFEFSLDCLTGSAHQKWDMPVTEIMIGRPNQGSGLRDTMSDLIVDSLGALVTSIITYVMTKFKKEKTAARIKKMISDGAEEPRV
jgi:VanZ family protein